MFGFLTPTPEGPGFDFYVLWNTGRAILEGQSPYYVTNALYPPATSYLFVILALLPITTSYFLWILVNGVILVRIKKWKSLGWLTFVPLLFVFVAGQVDLVFFALIPLLSKDKNDWEPAIAASLLTLKPQLGIVILPWWLIRWLISKRSVFTKFLIISLSIHLVPLLIRPTVYVEWFATTGWGMGHKFGDSGIWMLENQVNTIILGVVAVFLSIWGITRNNEKLSRIAFTLVNPVFSFYDNLILMDTAPWWILGPVSLLALGASQYIGINHAPYVAIPIVSLIWIISKKKAEDTNFPLNKPY